MGLFRLLTEGDEGIIPHDGLGVAEYQDLAIFPLHIVMKAFFIKVLQSPQPDRRMRGRMDPTHHDPHVVLLQRVLLILHQTESAVQMIVIRFIPHFVKREIDVVIPQFPDVEFAVDGLSFGLCFCPRVIPCRIAEPGNKFDVFHRFTGFVHYGPVQRGLQRGEIDPINEESPGEDGGGASGRPDGTEDRQADDEEKTQTVILLRHEDRSFMLEGGSFVTGLNPGPPI